MELVTPGIGIMFWMTISFLILLFILKKFAWKPILKMLKDREESIAAAFNAAEKAHEEFLVLEAKNQEMIQQNKMQRLAMMEETEKLRFKMMEEVKEDAKKQSEKMLKQVQERIENEKKMAFLDLRKDVTNISVEIASKVLREQLKSDQKAVEFAEHLIDEMQLN